MIMDTLEEKQLLELSITYGEGCRQQKKKKPIHMELLDVPLKDGDLAGFIKAFDKLAGEAFAVCDEMLDYMSVVKTIYEKELEGRQEFFTAFFLGK